MDFTFLQQHLGTLSKKKNGIFGDMCSNSRDTYPPPPISDMLNGDKCFSIQDPTPLM